MRLSNFNLLVLSALVSVNTFAAINANTGLYLGIGDAGYNFRVPQGSSFSSSFGHIFPNEMFRPVIGYRVNDYLAFEAAYNDVVNDSNSGDSVLGPDRLRIYSYDFSAKGILSFESGFSAFAKGGIALTHQYVFNQLYANNSNSVIVDSMSNRTQPLAGIGASYNFTKNISADMFYNYYFESGDIGEMRMLGIEFTYTFGKE